MWFAFGIITLVGFTIGFIRFRIRRAWKGIPASVDGQEYLFNKTSDRKRLTGLCIGLPCHTDLDFCLKRESVIDRFFKSLGLSEEQQLNRLHFDQSIYVVSDDRRLGRTLKYHDTLPAQLEEAFDEGYSPYWKIKALCCQGGQLWIECKPQGDAADAHIEAMARQVVPLLRTLAGHLADKAPPAPGRRDTFIVKAGVLLGLSSALAVNAAIQAFRIIEVDDAIILDREALFRMACTSGALVTALLVTLCIVLLGRTSRAHLVLIELVTIGALGAVGTSWVEITDINRQRDTATPRIEYTSVVDTRWTNCGSSKRRRTCYYVELAGAPALEGRSREFEISRTMYDVYKPQQRVRLTIHPGALGIRWMDEPQPE